MFNLQIASTLFQGAINFLCSGAPPQGACTVPPSVTVSGNSAAPFQVTVTTTAPTAASRASENRKLPGLSRPPFVLIVILLVSVMSRTVLRVIFLNRRIFTRAFLVAFFCCAAIGLTTCGGGRTGGGGGGGSGGGGGGGGGGNTATPPGTYMLTVTGSDGERQALDSIDRNSDVKLTGRCPKFRRSASA